MAHTAMRGARRRIPAVIVTASLCATLPPLPAALTKQVAPVAMPTAIATDDMAGAASVYRLRDPRSGRCAYTPRGREMGALILSGWTYEGRGQLYTGVGWTETADPATAETADALTDLRAQIAAGQRVYERSWDWAEDDQARADLDRALQDARTLKGITTADEARAAADAIATAADAVNASLDDDPVLTSMIGWASAIADDDSHGYSQVTRYGNPNYDCSSLVYYAATHAGFPLGDIAADGFWTGNEGERLEAAGWVRVGGSELTPGNGLHWGDIVVVNNYKRQHTEIYIGGARILGARGGDLDDADGDSSGDEISVTSWHDGVFTDVYRWKGTPEDLQAINTAFAAVESAQANADEANAAAQEAQAEADAAQAAAQDAAQKAADAQTAADEATAAGPEAGEASAAQDTAQKAADAAAAAADEADAKAQAAQAAQAALDEATAAVTTATAALDAARATAASR